MSNPLTVWYAFGMSNAEVISAPQTRTFDENVAAVVRVLMAMDDLDAVDLAPRVGMTKSTLYNRMAGKGWLAAELDRIAAYFDKAPAIFFQPVEQVVDTQNWKELSPSDLQVLVGGAEDGSAGRDVTRPRHLTLL